MKKAQSRKNKSDHRKMLVRGSAMAEYLVAAAFVSAALFIPVFQEEGGDGRRSAAEMLAEAIIENYRAYVWAMSIPV